MEASVIHDVSQQQQPIEKISDKAGSPIQDHSAVVEQLRLSPKSARSNLDKSVRSNRSGIPNGVIASGEKEAHKASP